MASTPTESFLYQPHEALLGIADTLHDFWPFLRNHPPSLEHLNRLVRALPKYPTECADALDAIQQCLHGQPTHITVSGIEWKTTAFLERVYPDLAVEESVLELDEGSIAATLKGIMDGTHPSLQGIQGCLVIKAKGIHSLLYKGGNKVTAVDRTIAVDGHGTSSVRDTLRKMILQYMTGDSDLYLTYDAAATKTAFMILQQAQQQQQQQSQQAQQQQVYSVVTPQNMYDSGPMAENVAMSDQAIYYFPKTPSAPSEQPQKETFLSRRNLFSRSFYDMIYENHGFDQDHPSQFQYMIRDRSSESVFPITMKGSQKDGPSTAYLTSLLRTLGDHKSDSPQTLLQRLAAVTPDKATIIPFMSQMGKGDPALKDMVLRFVQHLKEDRMGFFFDAKRCGDQDQADAAQLASAVFGSAVCLVTGDILCATFGRLLGLPVILETVQYQPEKMSVTRIYRSSSSFSLQGTEQQKQQKQQQRRMERLRPVLEVLKRQKGKPSLLEQRFYRWIGLLESDAAENPLRPQGAFHEGLQQLKVLDAASTLHHILGSIATIRKQEAEEAAEATNVVEAIYRREWVWDVTAWRELANQIKNDPHGARDKDLLMKYIVIQPIVLRELSRITPMTMVTRTRTTPQADAIIKNRVILRVNERWEEYVLSFQSPVLYQGKTIREWLRDSITFPLPLIPLEGITADRLSRALEERNAHLLSFRGKVDRLVQGLQQRRRGGGKPHPFDQAILHLAPSDPSDPLAPSDPHSYNEESPWNYERHNAIVSVGGTLARYLLDQAASRYAPMLFQHRLSVLCQAQPTLSTIRQHLYEWHCLSRQGRQGQEQGQQIQELLEKADRLYQEIEESHIQEQNQHLLDQFRQLSRPTVTPTYPSFQEWHSSLQEWADEMPACAEMYQELSYQSPRALMDTQEDDVKMDQEQQDEKDDVKMDLEQKEREENEPSQARPQHQIQDDSYIDDQLILLLASPHKEDRVRALLVFPRLAIHLRGVKNSFLAGMYRTFPEFPALTTWEDISTWLREPAPSAPSVPSTSPTSAASSAPLEPSTPPRAPRIRPIRSTPSRSWMRLPSTRKKKPSVIKPPRSLRFPSSTLKARRMPPTAANVSRTVRNLFSMGRLVRGGKNKNKSTKTKRVRRQRLKENKTSPLQ